MESSGAGIDLILSSISYTLPSNVENLTLSLEAGDINGIGNTLANILTGNDASNILNGGAGADTLKGSGGTDTLTGGTGMDTFKLTTTAGGADLITDFLSGTDTVCINDLVSGLGIGDQDGVIDNAITIPGLGGFTPSNELVIVTGNIIGPITATSAAASIGSATTAYTEGYAGLFVVDNGTDSALFKFVSVAADEGVSDTELTLIGILQDTASTAMSDYVFGV